jgi:hypothetical protein
MPIHQPRRALPHARRLLASFLALLLLTPLLSLTAPAAPASADEPAHRYLVYLPGATSDGALALSDFSAIDQSLRQPGPDSVGEPLAASVYFSYAAASAAAANAPRCVGWGLEACDPDGNLVSLSLPPVYAVQDTRASAPDDHAATLGWLLGQIVRQDPQARIDLVGFSLGGVIASRWAAQQDGLDGLVGHVHALVLLESPVGGVPAGVAPASRVLLEAAFGAPVLDALAPPADPTCAGDTSSFVCSLRQAATRLDVTSIESGADYFVNGAPVPVLGMGPVVVGRGAAGWLPDRLVARQDNQGGSLAAAPLPLPGAVDLVFGNHRLPLFNPQTASLIAQALREPGRPGCAFRLGFGTIQRLLLDPVGACAEDEHPDPDTGNILQQTTRGLLVYRQADNWTAFTDGGTTWINGPCGLQARPNDALFPWESGGDC